MKLTIDVDQSWEGDLWGTLSSQDGTILARTSSQPTAGHALRRIAALLEMSAEVVHAACHNVPLDRHHPRVRRALGWADADPPKAP
jgi:hypothetical protein